MALAQLQDVLELRRVARQQGNVQQALRHRFLGGVSVGVQRLPSLHNGLPLNMATAIRSPIQEDIRSRLGAALNRKKKPPPSASIKIGFQ